MTEKLLQKSSKIYLLFWIPLLILSIPVTYILIENLYLDDADEALILRKQEFEFLDAKKLKESDIKLWNQFNNDVKIFPNKGLQNDSIFKTYYYNALNYENEPYRELNGPVWIDGKSYTFSARINLVETEDLIIGIVMLFFFMISLMLTGIFIINKKVLIRLWKPFYETLNRIEKFEIDKKNDNKWSDTNIEEFVRLNQSIDQLIAKNTAIYKSQQEFTENAAHELQTPLAVFQAKVDSLSQSENLSESQAEIIASLNESIARINRLNKNLLLISKIENDFVSENQSFLLNEMIEKQFSFFQEQAESKNIEMVLDLKEQIQLNTNPSLTEILISNLWMNAIRHNVKNGKIQIHLQNKTLQFSNTGDENALNEKMLFERFSKGDSSMQGNGLGLAIAKKITDRNHWKLEYSFSENLHHFSVKF